MPTTFALIPGAGGSAYFWHRAVPLLTASGAHVVDHPGEPDGARRGRDAGIVVADDGSGGRPIGVLDRIVLGDRAFDPVEDFFHDVPDAIREEALSKPEPQQSDAPFEQAWPLDGWPCRSDPGGARQRRPTVPLEFQRRIVRELADRLLAALGALTAAT